MLAIKQGRPGLLQEFLQERLAFDQGLGTQVFTVKRQEIESDIAYRRCITIRKCLLQQSEATQALIILNDRFAIDQGRCLELQECRNEGREFLRPVEAGAGIKLRPIGRDRGKQAIAVIFDLVDPARPVRRAILEQSELRRDEGWKPCCRPVARHGTNAFWTLNASSRRCARYPTCRGGLRRFFAISRSGRGRDLHIGRAP